jgi:two-component system cell cycle sensor histidine kinase/response regulator CckA
MNNSDMLKNNRILIVDDNPSIHEDIRKILSDQGERNRAFDTTKALLFGDDLPESESTHFEIHSAHQGKEGLEMVEKAVETGRPYAMAFVDVRMPPGWDGVETISRIWEKHPDLQIVICTAYSDYSWAEMIRQFGKTDSLVILKKPFDNIEVLQLAHALTEKWQLSFQVRNRLNDLDQAVSQRTAELQSANEKLTKEMAERMQVEKSLRLSEERFSKAFKASPIPLAIQSLRQEIFVDANLGFQKLTGYSHAELIGQTPQELNICGDPPGDTTIFHKVQEQMSMRNLPRRLRTKSGQIRDILMSVEQFELDNEPLLLTIAQDITEQSNLENQLRQAQKMEAVGQLAAGLAHDFNNILTVIQGYSTLLLSSKPSESTDRKPLQMITGAAERARKLVRQLLTFSRKQIVQKTAMDIHSTLSEISEMLPRVLPENIQVTISAPPDLPQISADPGMMEQMLMNLAVNACDAMTDGGRFTINVEELEVTSDLARDHKDARPGRFLCMTVADTGCGMPMDVLSHIFEPFFTTKPVGKGTGLGLATVYGIIKQHDGWVEVQSEPGQGTTFRIFIPARKVKAKPESARPTPKPACRGTETILVVEDEAEVRDFVIEVLGSHGYQTIVAESGPQALERWAQNRGKIDLLLTDMVMPGGLSGRQVGERLLADNPALKVVYTSGYGVGMAGKDDTVLKQKNFLPKPYCPATLLETLRHCLDRPAEEFAITSAQ